MSSIDDLRRNGIFRVDAAMSPGQVDDFIAALRWTEMYHTHVKAKATEPPAANYNDAVRRSWQVFAPSMEAVVKAPHWFEVAIGYFGLAKEYYGQMPRLYSINAFWTRWWPGAPIYKETQAWHRDGSDGAKQFTLFMLGTDIPALEAGGHLYQRGSHLAPELGDNHAPDPGVVESVFGPRGTMVVEDTGGTHCGIVSTMPRLLVWARFGLLNPPQSYINDGLSPVPAALLGDRYPRDPALQEAIRLVVA